MSTADMTCPRCAASMQGDPIPEEHRRHKPDCEERKAESPFGNCYCLPYGEGVTHFSRVMGHEVRGVYDGILYWSCPDCGTAWPRFADGRLAERGAKFVALHNARTDDEVSAS